MNARPAFIEQLRAAARAQRSLLSVGLDPIYEALPADYPHSKQGALAFCRAIIDAVAGSVCVFKAQVAHFAAIGAEEELACLIAHIHARHPALPVILDAKRGDIGSTAERYAVEAFERYDADAVTVNPYLGGESLMPFLRYAERGVLIVCRSSNPGNALIQEHPASDPAYLRVARAAAAEWSFNDNVMLVAGATYPDALARIRAVAPELPLLLPGIGRQGADLEAALDAGLDGSGGGVVINNARGVLYASSGVDHAEAARDAAESLRKEINVLKYKLRPSSE